MPVVISKPGRHSCAKQIRFRDLDPIPKIVAAKCDSRPALSVRGMEGLPIRVGTAIFRENMEKGQLEVWVDPNHIDPLLLS